jgi:hypothetical protein
MYLLMFSLVLIGFGAYSTYLLATSLPEQVLDAASKHGRFSGIGDETVHKDGTKLAINKLSERKGKRQSTSSASS